MGGFLVSIIMGISLGFLFSLLVEQYFGAKGENVSRLTKNIIALSYSVLITIIIYYGLGIFYLISNPPIGLHWVILGSFIGHFGLIMFVFGIKEGITKV